jgi:hypothetical protein
VPVALLKIAGALSDLSGFAEMSKPAIFPGYLL